MTQTPGGLYERFFEEVGEEATGDVFTASLDEGSPEAARFAAIAARYGIEITLLGGRARSGHSSRPNRDNAS